MTLDVPSLNAALMAVMLALGVSLPVLMGLNTSPTARRAVGSLLLQGVGSALALHPGYSQGQGWPLVVTAASIGATAASLALLSWAVADWLGHRFNRTRYAALALAVPVGYILLGPVMELRTVWANGLFTVLLVWTCTLLARPASPDTRRWRGVLLVSLLALAASIAWRAVAAALTPERYLSFLAPHPANVAATFLQVAGIVGCTVALMVAWRDEAERELRRLAQTDPLTQLLNRRAFLERAAPLWAAAQRHGHALSVMLVDLDHFKRINDTRGHAVGDEALRLASRLLRDTARSEDLACRWGGEEFCVLFPQDGAEAAASLDHRLRHLMREASYPALGFGLDFSAGVAALDGTDRSLDDLIRRADEALYAAKKQGRGRLAHAMAA